MCDWLMCLCFVHYRMYANVRGEKDENLNSEVLCEQSTWYEQEIAVQKCCLSGVNAVCMTYYMLSNVIASEIVQTYLQPVVMIHRCFFSKPYVLHCCFFIGSHHKHGFLY